MIRCRLLEMMGRKGIRFISHLSHETGINRRTLAILAENKMERYDAEVLERLCRFFACQPGDLLELHSDPVAPGWLPSEPFKP
jgi:putative transcriptional regulator